MSRYTIRHACGHTVVHKIIGSNADRKVTWRAQRICFDCKNAEEKEAAEKSTAHLPPLTGTDKQINWATTIRAKAVESLELLRKKTGRDILYHPEQAGYFRQVIAFIDATLAQTESLYWIDNRKETFDWRWVRLKLPSGLTGQDLR